MRARRPAFILFLGVVGCIHDIHPDYHPEVHYTLVENVTYMTTIVDRVVARAGAQGGEKDRRAERPSVTTTGAPAEVDLRATLARADAPSDTRGAPRLTPGTDPLPFVETRLPLADARRIQRARYARFTARLASAPEERSSELSPLDGYGGSSFDVRPDPENPSLAIVRFGVWKHQLYPDAAVLVTTSSGELQPILSYGRIRSGVAEAAPSTAATGARHAS